MPSSSSSTPGWYFGSRAICDCCCDCYDGTPGDRGGVAGGTVNSFNSTVNQSTIGLHGGAFNIPFGSESTYSNQVSSGGTFGNSWFSHDLAGLDVSDLNEITYTEGANQTEVFIRDGALNVWNGAYFVRSRLTFSGGVYTMTLKDGSQRKFNSTGKLTKLICPGGTELAVGYDTSGKLNSVSGTHSGHTVDYQYDWNTAGTRIRSIIQRLDAVEIQKVDYAYYTGGNLQRVTISELRSGVWTAAEQQFFTYYSTSGTSDNAGRLQHVFGDAALRRMASVNIDPATASLSELNAYADVKYAYDANNKVQDVWTQGGLNHWSLVYHADGSVGDTPNDWTNRTVVSQSGTGPVPSVVSMETVYFNRAGSVLLRKLEEYQSGTLRRTWYPVCQQFDTQLRIIQAISADAISSVSQVLPKLFTLHANAGLIRHFSYDSNSGAIHQEWLTKGTAGTGLDSRLIRTITYVSSVPTAPDTGIWVPWQNTEYRNGVDDAAGRLITGYSYLWHSAFQMQQRTTTLPVVSAAEHGSGVATATVEIWNAAGFLISMADQAGVVTTYVYDEVTGGIKQKTEDPAGLNLITNYVPDDEGRTTIEKGPVHEIALNGTLTKIRRAVWTFYRDVEKERVTFPGYIKMAADGITELTSHCVGPVNISRGFVAPTVPDGTSFSDTLSAEWTLTRMPLADEVYLQSTWKRWQRQRFSTGGRLFAELLYHQIPAGEGAVNIDYALTSYGYDDFGHQNQVTTPGGTIQKTVFNALGQPLEQWTGISSGTLVRTSLSIYDTGATTGPGLLTSITLFVDGVAANNRVQNYAYDWRHRLEMSDILVTLGTTPTKLITKNTYDNRDNSIEVREYQFSVAAGNLLSQTLTSFDGLGRPFKVQRYRVDPGQSSDPGSYLEDNTWYDAVGRVRVQKPAGSQAYENIVYDAVGRTKKTFTAYGAADPLSIATATVMEQREIDYDPAGNVISVTQRQRYEDSTNLGELQGPGTTQPRARVSYSASYPDSLGRTVATANFGTHDNASWSRPPLIPACTDAVLVNLTAYNLSGEPWQTTDPMLAVTTRTCDAAGRLKEELQGRVPGRIVPAIDRKTSYEYNADGNLTLLIARNNPASGLEDQITEWVYGVTTAGGSLLDSKLLVAKKIYPDSTGGSDVVAYTYNLAGQVRTMTDQTGLVHTYGYDQLGRQTQDAVTAWGSSAADRSIERLTTRYDARGLVVQADSFGSAGPAANSVSFAHNGWRQLITETQAAGSVSRNVQYGYDGTGAGLVTTIRRNYLLYPSAPSAAAGPAAVYTYSGPHADQLSRPSHIQALEGSSVGSMINYEYLGLQNPVGVSYIQPNCKMTLGDSASNYAGLDRFGRPVDIKWRKGTSAILVQAQYGYDRSSNRQWRYDAAAHAAGVTSEDQWYDYDGLYQVQNFRRGALTGAYPNFSGITPVAQNQSWNYDAMGNWLGFNNDALSQTRQFNKVNEITSITGPSGAITPAYDPAGNMTTMPAVANWTTAQTLTWDAWNRLVRVASGGTTIAEYTYDALFRRITKTISGTTRRFYYSDQWQILEEYVGTSTTPEVRYWYGLRDINDIARRQTFGTGAIDLYALRETMNVVALVNTSGTVTQRMSYDAFGNVRFLNGSTWAAGTNLAGWQMLYHAHYRDEETELYQMRYRYFHPNLGVWLSRDFIEETEDENGYLFCSNNGLNRWDPLGTLDVEINYPNAAQTKINMNKKGGSFTSFDGSSVKCKCECVKNPPKPKEYHVRCKVKLEAKITISRAQAALYKTTIQGIQGHEQRHVLSAIHWVGKEISEPLSKEPSDFMDKNKCKTAASSYEAKYGAALAQGLHDHYPDHADKPGKTTPHSPKNATSYRPLPGSISIK